MKIARFTSLLGSLFALALIVGLAGSAAAQGKVLNPQAGATWSAYSFDDDESVEDEARIGWTLGGNIRFGGKLYFAPGLYYQSTGFEATAVDDVTLEEITESVGVNSIQVPVLVGYNLSSAEPSAPGGLGLRVYAGPSMSFVTSVGDNAFGLEKEDYASSIFGGVIGAGFDLTAITFDVNYEIGFSEVFEDDVANAKQNVLRGLVGIKL